MTRFAASLVVPTFERCDQIVEMVRQLEKQTTKESFEVLVSIDGSSDGTLAELNALRPTFSLRLLFHSNRGLVFTRNRGAALASGDVVIFLDDDMTPDPQLIAQHVASHIKGAEVVLGAMPLDSRSPDTLLARGVGAWGDELAGRLTDKEVRWNDVFGGHLSIRRELFETVGGFDRDFTRGGSYGNEDLDFGYRLVAAGSRIVFNPRAIAHQRFINTASTVLRQSFESGVADVLLARKHPAVAQELFAQDPSSISRLARLLCLLPGLGYLARALEPATSRVVDRSRGGWWLSRWYHLLRSIERWQGVKSAGGVPKQRRFRVLCYHAMEDLSDCPVLEPYGVPLQQFADQLDLLAADGYRFLDPIEAVEALTGKRGIPRRGVLLTFDDGYSSTLEAGRLLRERHIRALVFAVTEQVGKTNAWDRHLGARPLDLMGREQLLAWTGLGHEVGSHTRSHPILPQLAEDEVLGQIEGSFEDLKGLGLENTRTLAYPYGEHDQLCVDSCQRLGVDVAFSLRAGFARSGKERFRVPRIEILRQSANARFLRQVRWGGFSLGVITRSVARRCLPDIVRRRLRRLRAIS